MPNNTFITRAFSAREKVLLGVLAVLLVVGCYYFLVVKNVADTQARNAVQLEEVQSEITTQTALVTARSQMLEKLKALGPTDQLPEVAVYDNVRNELDSLNTALGNATSYNLNFEKPELEGSLVRRAVGISFTVPTTNEAISVMRELQNGKYACEITDFSLTNALKTTGSVSSVAVTLSLTYFETTSGSTNLQGLVEKKPEASSAAATT